MSRPPLARESVLDAFSAILIEDGERTATLDATARRAGVSKGGLLYHFASKDALVDALVERMRVLSIEDVAEITGSSEGAIASFVRTSIMSGTPLDRAIIAVSRLAQGGHETASQALRDLRALWEATIRPDARDEVALQLIMLVSDGLYFNNALGAGVTGPIPTGRALDELIALVKASAGREQSAP